MNTKQQIEELVSKIWESAQLEIKELHDEAYTLPGDMTKAQATDTIEALVVEAQTNAVTWSIGVIDDMHDDELYDRQLNEGSVGDKGYKGIKNRIRQRYENEIGVDPAPHYPVKAALSSSIGETK